MFAVIFEVQPKQERWDDYLVIAKRLKPSLEAIEGFIDNDRFKSLRDGRRLLSVSTWADEKALVRWRVHGGHHAAQERGRFEIFEDYRLRVGEIASDSGLAESAFAHQQRFDETKAGGAKWASVTEIVLSDRAGAAMQSETAAAASVGLARDAAGLVSLEAFASIYTQGKLALLASWRDEQAARGWSPVAGPGAKDVRHRRVRIIRDYGMFDRREAPQFYPDVARPQQGRS
jgi:heme-degrading monooxygenase HmoA